MRIENTTEGHKDFHVKPKGDHLAPDVFQVPRAWEGKNGFAEIPDEIVRLMLKDPVSKAWFESGELIESRGRMPVLPEFKDDPGAGKASAK